MSGVCVCPDVQEFDGVVTIPTEPLRCQCCGSPLRLTCDGECGSEHVRRAFDTATANVRAVTPVGKPGSVGKSIEKSAEPKPPAVPWECQRCNATIPKKTGRPPKFCATCLTDDERARLERKREWNDQVRAKRMGMA